MAKTNKYLSNLSIDGLALKEYRQCIVKLVNADKANPIEFAITGFLSRICKPMIRVKPRIVFMAPANVYLSGRFVGAILNWMGRQLSGIALQEGTTSAMILPFQILPMSKGRM